MPIASFESIPGGWQGTASTIQKMHRLINTGKTDLVVQRIADQVIKNSSARDRAYEDQAKALFDFTKGYVRFQRDPFGVEMLQDPIVTLSRKAGDCDDHVTLNCALLGSVGFPYAIKTIKADETRPDEFSHVYALVHIAGKGWIPFDTSVGPSYFGWEPPGKLGFQIWPPKVD